MKNFKGYIYCHTSPNNKQYNGQTRMERPELRWSGKNPYSSNPHFHAAIQKYEWKNFKHEILEVIECDSFEELVQQLNLKEEFYIKGHNSMIPNGYNLRAGGNVVPPTAETIEKIRATNKKYKPTEEARRKQSLAQMGHTVSDETRRKISEKNSGRVFGEEFRQKCSASKMGNTNAKGHTLTETSKQQMLETRKKNGTDKWTDQHRETIKLKQERDELHWSLSDETKAKISAARKGMKFSEEHRKKLSEWQKGKPKPDCGKYERTPQIQWKSFKKRLLSGTYFTNPTSPHKGKYITEEQFMEALNCIKNNTLCDTVPVYFLETISRLVDRLGYPDMEEAQDVTE